MGSSSERSSAPESQLLSRRTLVRAGATAAWTVPLVQVVSSAPAQAAQSPITPPNNTTTLEITSSSLAYDTSDASRLTFTATVKNKGNVATSGLQLVATLPANGYTQAPTSTAPTQGSGWTGPTGGGSASAGWSLTYTAGTVAPGASVTLSVVVTLHDSSAAVTHEGGQLTFGLSAVGSNASAVASSVTAPVLTTVMTAQLNGAALAFGGSGNTRTVVVSGATYKNTGTIRSSGAVTAVVTILKTAGRLATAPNNPTGVASGWTFVSSDRTSATGPWTYTFTAQSVAPGDSTPALSATFLMTTQSGTGDGSGRIAASATHGAQATSGDLTIK